MASFHDAARRLAHVVEGRPRGSRWFLHCDSDADGLTAAAVVANALRRAGHQFQVRASREKDDATYRDLASIEADGYFVLDKGTSHVHILGEVAASTGKPVLVIDHHNILHDEVPDGVHLLNPRVMGLDGSRDACSSTSAVAFAKAMDPRNMDQGPIGLVGAIGDWQHQGGWTGWNAKIVEEGLEHGHLQKRPQSAFIGMDLAEAIARWEHPKIPELHGEPDATRTFLDSIGLPRDLDNESLDAAQETRLLSALLLHGAAHGMAPEDMDKLVRHELTSTKLDLGLRRLFRVVDACGREGHAGTGLAYLLGDSSAKDAAHAIFQGYRDTIATDLERLRRIGPKVRSHLQHFAIERDAYTGMVAGIGMTHTVARRDIPLVVSAPRGDDQNQISTRGLEPLVANGLDLGDACRIAAASLDSAGGGHPVAAGAVVPADGLNAFLDALNDALAAQGFLEANGV